MRREIRRRNKGYKFFYITGTLAIVLTLALVVLYKTYNSKLNDISKSMLSTEDIIGLVPNNEEDVKGGDEVKVSSSLSKDIEEAINSNEVVKAEETKEEGETLPTESNETTQETKTEPKKELSFAYPVEGEKLREFAMETLIYSETLEEWTAHQGLDIKAQRTTVVKASEAGTVSAIKNDPRYGLTVIIEHEDGFKTVYSNLLSTEFVTEDEKVEKGQSIGTVGNSGIFEIADEPHLHFEIIKDGKYVNPSLYLK